MAAIGGSEVAARKNDSEETTGEDAGRKRRERIRKKTAVPVVVAGKVEIGVKCFVAKRLRDRQVF